MLQSSKKSFVVKIPATFPSKMQLLFNLANFFPLLSKLNFTNHFRRVDVQDQEQYENFLVLRNETMASLIQLYGSTIEKCFSANTKGDF